MEIKPIAYFRSPLKEKFGTPRQAGLIPGLQGFIEFCEGFEPAMLDGLEGFDFIWLIWGFNLNRPTEGQASKVRPPRLGGNDKMGVYATRSPYRPNPLGLSSVRVASIDAASGRIEVLGADLVDGTPVFDIKPYIEYADSHPGIRSGFAADIPATLQVRFPDSGKWPITQKKQEAAFSKKEHGSSDGQCRNRVPIAGHGTTLCPSRRDEALQELSPEDLQVLEQILAQDPRPAYHDDPERIYGLSFKGKNVRFKVEADTLTVISID